MVDTLGGTAHHGLEILAEVGWLELRVQLGGQMVAEIPGILRVVIATDAPGVLIFGEVSRDELDRVERIGFAGLPGCEDAAANSLLGNLRKENNEYTDNLRGNGISMWCITYVVSVDLLLADLLHQAVNLVLRGDQVVGENLLVQGARVIDDQSHVATDIAQVGERRWHVSIADDLIVTGGHRIVDAAGEKARVGELVPPTDINDGVGEPELADLVVDNFFLE